MTLPKLTKLELQIMDALWNHGASSIRNLNIARTLRREKHETFFVAIDGEEITSTESEEPRAQDLDQLRGLANILHLLHFFRRQLQPKFLLQGKHEVQMLGGIPGLDRFRRRLGGDSIYGDTEQI